LETKAFQEAQRAGTEHAKALEGRYRGRKPPYNWPQLENRAVPCGPGGTSAIAKATGLTRQTVLRIKADPVEAEANLAT
jgi:DNA invertase Pin-like site-specific DNA recombinase